MVNDDCLDDLIDVSLAGDLVLALRRGHECGTEAYGQVVRVHHVLIAVLGQTGGGQRQNSRYVQNFSDRKLLQLKRQIQINSWRSLYLLVEEGKEVAHDNED